MDCNFCGYGIPRGTEYIFVTSKGKALHFCSSKCYKNMVKLGRTPRDTRWTKFYFDDKEARLKTAGQRVEAPAKAEKVEKPPKSNIQAPAEKPAKTAKKVQAKAKKEEPKPKKKAGK